MRKLFVALICGLVVLGLVAGAALAQSWNEPIKGKYLSMSKMSWSVAEPVSIVWKGTPGNAQDWITVVPQETPANKWGKWTYLKSKTSGVYTLRLTRGLYAARLYFNWPSGGFKIQDELHFEVK